MSLKKAAEELLKIADEMERDAADVTMFVCDACNHTASLSSINEKRTQVVKEAGDNVVAEEVAINDQVICPACDGVMAYRATEASAAYYFDPDKKAEDEEKKPEEEEEKVPEGAKECKAFDYDSLGRYLA